MVLNLSIFPPALAKSYPRSDRVEAWTAADLLGSLMTWWPEMVILNISCPLTDNSRVYIVTSKSEIKWQGKFLQRRKENNAIGLDHSCMPQVEVFWFVNKFVIDESKLRLKSRPSKMPDVTWRTPSRQFSSPLNLIILYFAMNNFFIRQAFFFHTMFLFLFAPLCFDQLSDPETLNNEKLEKHKRWPLSSSSLTLCHCASVYAILSLGHWYLTQINCAKCYVATVYLYLHNALSQRCYQSIITMLSKHDHAINKRLSRFPSQSLSILQLWLTSTIYKLRRKSSRNSFCTPKSSPFSHTKDPVVSASILYAKISGHFSEDNLHPTTTPFGILRCVFFYFFEVFQSLRHSTVLFHMLSKSLDERHILKESQPKDYGEVRIRVSPGWIRGEIDIRWRAVYCAHPPWDSAVLNGIWSPVLWNHWRVKQGVIVRVGRCASVISDWQRLRYEPWHGRRRRRCDDRRHWGWYGMHHVLWRARRCIDWLFGLTSQCVPVVEIIVLTAIGSYEPGCGWSARTRWLFGIQRVCGNYFDTFGLVRRLWCENPVLVLGNVHQNPGIQLGIVFSINHLLAAVTEKEGWWKIFWTPRFMCEEFVGGRRISSGHLFRKERLGDALIAVFSVRSPRLFDHRGMWAGSIPSRIIAHLSKREVAAWVGVEVIDSLIFFFSSSDHWESRGLRCHRFFVKWSPVSDGISRICISYFERPSGRIPVIFIGAKTKTVIFLIRLTWGHRPHRSSRFFANAQRATSPRPFSGLCTRVRHGLEHRTRVR